MNRIASSVWAVLSSRAISPIVLGIFLLVYIVVAFGTEDALIALMGLTSGSLLLQLLLAVLPLSSASRLCLEATRRLQRGRLLRGGGTPAPGLFDERVEIAGSGSFERLEAVLSSEGYATRRGDGSLGAWRGGGGGAARILFLAGTFSLFAGILISVSTRDTHRTTVIEGQPMPTATGGGGTVEKISLVPATGRILQQDLVMQVAPSQQGDPGKRFTLYPPSMYRGNFVYPRYLGIAPQISLSAPDLKEPYLAFHVANIYPPGKEDKTALADIPYRMMLTLAPSADHSDPFSSGRATVMFKLLRGDAVVVAGSAPLGGGEFVKDGYRVSFPGYRRTVQTDFVRDYGVPLIWSSAVLFLLSACVWLPSRALFPRREMLFVRQGAVVVGLSRAEGARRRHGGVFHEALDLLESGGSPAPAEEIGAAEMAGN